MTECIDLNWTCRTLEHYCMIMIMRWKWMPTTVRSLIQCEVRQPLLTIVGSPQNVGHLGFDHPCVPEYLCACVRVSIINNS